MKDDRKHWHTGNRELNGRFKWLREPGEEDYCEYSDEYAFEDAAKEQLDLSLADDVMAALAARDNASEYVSQLVRAAEAGPLPVALSDAERLDAQEAATEAGLELPAWARVILCAAAGRPISQHVDAAHEAHNRLFAAELGKVLAPKRAQKASRSR